MATGDEHGVRIGVDFDNTIADYDELFLLEARTSGLVREGYSGGKEAIRAAARASHGGEARWMELQGRVYGALMGHARLVDGFIEFLARGREAGVSLYIISHKTEFGHFDPERINLRDAAMGWMDAQGFFEHHGLSRERVFFEATRREKIERIHAVGCAHFIDDLEEVFREPSFPAGVGRALLSRGGGVLPAGPFTAYRSWHEISDALFG